MRQLKFIALALIASVQAADVSYLKNGDDWPKSDGECKTGTQSPIDLPTTADKTSYKEKGYFYKFYPNVFSTPVTYKDAKSTNYVVLDANSPTKKTTDVVPAYFESKFGKDVFGAPLRFQVNAFHVHSQSEHTIDGKRFDLELHTVHHPATDLENPNKFAAAALGIIFDTTNYDKDVTKETVAVIDQFFESLKYDSASDPTPAVIHYGQLIQAVDTTNRWVYKGSVTTPPCAQTVYWNVVKKVYPIKKTHLDYYRNVQLARQTKQDIKKTGNFRNTQTVTSDHKLQLLTTEVTESKDYLVATVVLAVFLFFFMVATMMLAFYLRKFKHASGSSQISPGDMIQHAPLADNEQQSIEMPVKGSDK